MNTKAGERHLKQAVNYLTHKKDLMHLLKNLKTSREGKISSKNIRFHLFFHMEAVYIHLESQNISYRQYTLNTFLHYHILHMLDGLSQQ